MTFNFVLFMQLVTHKGVFEDLNLLILLDSSEEKEKELKPSFSNCPYNTKETFIQTFLVIVKGRHEEISNVSTLTNDYRIWTVLFDKPVLTLCKNNQINITTLFKMINFTDIF